MRLHALSPAPVSMDGGRGPCRPQATLLKAGSGGACGPAAEAAKREKLTKTPGGAALRTPDRAPRACIRNRAGAALKGREPCI